MNVNDIYATDGKYLKASDLKDRKHRLIIESSEIAEFKDGSKKIAVKFKDKEKGFVVNKTNAALIAKSHGNDTNDWVGKEIIIYPTTTDFGGEQVDCIRVERVVAEATDGDDVPF